MKCASSFCDRIGGYFADLGQLLLSMKQSDLTSSSNQCRAVVDLPGGHATQSDLPIAKATRQGLATNANQPTAFAYQRHSTKPKHLNQLAFLTYAHTSGWTNWIAHRAVSAVIYALIYGAVFKLVQQVTRGEEIVLAVVVIAALFMWVSHVIG